MTATLFHVDHVLPGDRGPIGDGALLVAGEGDREPAGTILDVGPARDLLPRHAGAEVVRLRGLVLPGLVNAHTHLELSALRGRVPGGRGFVPWVEGLIGARSEVSPDEEPEAIEQAVADLERSGTVLVGEVTNSLAAVSALARHGIGGSVFHEVFGHDRASVLRRVEGLGAERLGRCAPWPTEDLRYAPAPHTLYTTHPEAVAALIEGARRLGHRTSLHLAEHASERRAIEHDEGPVPDWLLARTKSRPTFARRALFDYAEELGALAPDVLLVHLTDARPDELARVAERAAPVALCPRSNLTIEMRLPPLMAIRGAGLEAALGTDSLASSPSLDVLAEAKALADRFPGVPAHELLRMATYNGARALGRPDCGRLARGTRPGVLHVDAAVSGDPAAFLLAHLQLPRRFVVSRTRIVEA